MSAPDQSTVVAGADRVPAAPVHPSIAYFTGAYPGQAVSKGCPNRLRRAAHYARAAFIASQSGNVEIAEAWNAALKKLPLDLDVPATAT